MNNFRLVNLSHPDDIHDNEKILSDIRRHVMRTIGESRRCQRPELEGQLTLDLQNGEIMRSKYDSGGAESFDMGQSIKAQSASLVLGHRLENSLVPLGYFPVEANRRVLELVYFGKSR